ncbi:MAG: glycosyltransferase [Syntrophorhabdaceae bacterium]
MHKCILIAGMHRSGTSALAGALNLLGVNMGSRLMETAQDNEKGFFENADVYEVNEGILKSLNSSWDDLFFLEDGWWKSPIMDSHRLRIRELVEKEFLPGGLFGIKDPRLALLFPLWEGVLKELAVETACIIPLRNPLEVADSLHRRNGFSVEKSAFLWMKYLSDAEYYSRGMRRIFISFNDLLRDPEGTLLGIADAVGVQYPKTWQDAGGVIKAFLDPRIKHHDRIHETATPGMPAATGRYYRLLSACSGKEACGDALFREMDEIRSEYRLSQLSDAAYPLPAVPGGQEAGVGVPPAGDSGNDVCGKAGTKVARQGSRPEKAIPGMVTVIVVNYNGKGYLDSCFTSLLDMEQTGIPLEIVMVDNLSGDDSIRYVKERFPQVKIVENDLNNFARALNLGIKNASGEYVAFLNNDVRVEKNWLRGLLDVMRRDDKIGAVQSKILFSEGGAVNSAGVEEVEDFHFRDIGFREKDSGQYEEIREINYFSGGSVLLRRSCLDGVGEIDEDFIMFFEDVDFSIRAGNAGWKISYAPASIVHHRYHGVASSELADFFCSRNRLLCLAKHFPLRVSMAVRTSGFFLNREYDNLYQALIQAVKKILDHHPREVAMEAIGEIKNVIADLFGDGQACEFIASVEAIAGLRKIKMEICEGKLPVSQDGLSGIGTPINGPAFNPSNTAALMHMAATLDKPLIAVFNRVEDVKRVLQECESDRRLRLGQVHALTVMLRESEADRAARLTQVDQLSCMLRESEADRTARLEQIDALNIMLKESESDRAARLDQILELTRLLKESEADRAARFDVIEQLVQQIKKLGIEVIEAKQRADDLERGWLELEETFAVRQARRVGLIKVRRFTGPAAFLGENE